MSLEVHIPINIVFDSLGLSVYPVAMSQLPPRRPAIAHADCAVLALSPTRPTRLLARAVLLAKPRMNKGNPLAKTAPSALTAIPTWPPAANVSLQGTTA